MRLRISRSSLKRLALRSRLSNFAFKAFTYNFNLAFRRGCLYRQPLLAFGEEAESGFFVPYYAPNHSLVKNQELIHGVR